MYLSLFAHSRMARSVFLTVDDLLVAVEEADETQSKQMELLTAIYRANRPDIDGFLGKILPHQPNLEGETGFRFDEAAAADAIATIVKELSVDSSGDELTQNAYLSLKWNTDAMPARAQMALFLENFQLHLPSSLFSSVCKAVVAGHSKTLFSHLVVCLAGHVHLQ